MSVFDFFQRNFFSQPKLFFFPVQVCQCQCFSFSVQVLVSDAKFSLAPTIFKRCGVWMLVGWRTEDAAGSVELRCSLIQDIRAKNKDGGQQGPSQSVFELSFVLSEKRQNSLFFSFEWGDTAGDGSGKKIAGSSSRNVEPGSIYASLCSGQENHSSQICAWAYFSSSLGGTVAEN